MSIRLQARQVVEQAFGGWTAQAPNPRWNILPCRRTRPASCMCRIPSSVQTALKLAQTISVTRDDQARYALYLAMKCWAAVSMHRAYIRDLRDQRGLVYTVDTRFTLGKHRSTYAVSFGSDPDKVCCRERIGGAKNLKQMQQEPVSEEDLKRAKGILLRHIPLGESSYEQIGGQLLTLSIEDRPLDALTIAGQHYPATECV